MIHLDCPQCQRPLEIDDGFAGGVCRCFNCGTLMTVPVAGEHAERLTRTGGSRPDRPDTPGGEAPAPSTESGEQGEVFVTSTGRTVRLTEEQVSHVAVARKPRMGLRIGIIAGFVVLVIGMGAAIGILAMKALNAQEQEKQQKKIDRENELSRDLAPEVLSYDPQANPMLLTKANLFGLPLAVKADESPTVALVIDNSLTMRDYINFVAGVVEANVKALPKNVSAQVVFTDELGLHTMPDTPQKPDKWDMDALKQLLDTINPAGVQDLPAGLEKAMTGQPQRIVLVTAQAPIKPVMEKMGAALGADSPVQLDIVQLGRSNDALKDLAESHHGTYINLPAGQITNWYGEYQRKQ